MTADAARVTPPYPPGARARQSRRRAVRHGPEAADKEARPAQPGLPGLGGCLGLALRTWRAAPGASPGLLAHAGQLGPGGVEVALGALGPAAQLPARLLEHLRAEFQRAPQLVPLAGRVGAQLLELGGVRPGDFGQA